MQIRADPDSDPKTCIFEWDPDPQQKLNTDPSVLASEKICDEGLASLVEKNTGGSCFTGYHIAQLWVLNSVQK